MGTTPETPSSDRLRASKRLPSAPGIAVRVLELCREGEAGGAGKEIAELIASDPALAARVLRLANSPGTGVCREVVSIREAVLLMGVRSIKLAALGFSLAVPDENKGLGGFDLSEYWTNSHAAAVVARAAAKQTGLADGEEAYTTSLLAKVGRLALAQTVPIEYGAAMAAVAKGQPLLETERDHVGVDHAEFGSQLLSDWALPEALIEAVRWQFEPARATGRAKALAEITRAAHAIVPAMRAGPDAVAAVLQSEAAFKLDKAGWEALAAGVNQELASMAGALKATFSPQALLDLHAEAHDEAERVAMVNRLERSQAPDQTDGDLSGILPKPKFDLVLADMCHAAATAGKAAGIVVFSVEEFDRLRRENSTRADLVLARICRAVQNLLRGGETLGRISVGDIAILIPGATRETACVVAARVRQCADEMRVQGEHGVMGVSVNIGVALSSDFPKPPSPAELLGQVNKQVYLSRLAGGNTWSYHGQTAAKILKKKAG